MNFEWIDRNPWMVLVLGPAYAIALLFVILYAISQFGGWAALTRRFRASGPFNGESWKWQSARFRWGINYNNCMTVGANRDALYLSVMIPFHLFHPALLIPWHEIEVETGKVCFGLWDTARFRIGTEERVTLRIYGKLVPRVRQAAGQGWPLYLIEQMEAETKR
jgi:hypothetical protein